VQSTARELDVQNVTPLISDLKRAGDFRNLRRFYEQIKGPVMGFLVGEIPRLR
jgi:hypothetical protein